MSANHLLLKTISAAMRQIVVQHCWAAALIRKPDSLLKRQQHNDHKLNWRRKPQND